MAIVYRHIRLDKNQPFYIGMSVNSKRPYEKAHREKEWKEIYKSTSIQIGRAHV